MTVAPSPPAKQPGRPRSIALTWLGMVVVAGSVTVLFLALRGLFGLDAACSAAIAGGDGKDCPASVAVAVPVAVLVMPMGMAVAMAGSKPEPGPRLWLLAWPALFVAVGWNLWEYARRDDTVPAARWVCGAGTIVCGLLAVLGLRKLVTDSEVRHEVLWSDADGRFERYKQGSTDAPTATPVRGPVVTPDATSTKLVMWAVNLSAITAGVAIGLAVVDRLTT